VRTRVPARMLVVMFTSIQLPAPLSVRPLCIDDAAEVTELMAECEAVDLGEVMIELADIVGDWQRPSFDLAADTVGVYEEGRLLGYAEVYRARRAEVYVRPAARDRGIGTALLRWTWQRVRAAGGELVGQTVPERNAGAVALLRAHGYEPLWTSWVLALPAGTRVAEVALADGYAVRAYRDGEQEAVYRMIEDAFAEWPDRDPTAYPDWAAGVLARPGFEPWHLLVAVHGDDIVGACHLIMSGDGGWVNQIAVRREHRGRGLGQALLRAAFTAAADRGAQRFELNTDSRTGALGLYRHVGMTVTSTFVHYAKRL
jgi:mycothiol synthase